MAWRGDEKTWKRLSGTGFFYLRWHPTRLIAWSTLLDVQSGIHPRPPSGSGLEAELPMLRVPEKVTNVGILTITAQRGVRVCCMGTPLVSSCGKSPEMYG